MILRRCTKRGKFGCEDCEHGSYHERNDDCDTDQPHCGTCVAELTAEPIPTKKEGK